MMKLNDKKPFVCPWRAGPILTASIRKLFHDPRQILSSCLSEGMTAMDIGCGMGYFTLPMARIVGGGGHVVAVDLQPEMLEGLKRNAAGAGAANITPHQCAMDSLNIGQWNNKVDFALVFWMLHEVPDAKRLINEVAGAMTAQGKLLFVEPVMHVSGAAFRASKKMITESGFTVIDMPKIPLSRAALFSH